MIHAGAFVILIILRRTLAIEQTQKYSLGSGKRRLAAPGRCTTEQVYCSVKALLIKAIGRQMKDNVVTGSVGGIKPQRPQNSHEAALLYIDSVSNKVKHKFHPCFIHPWVGVFPFHIKQCLYSITKQSGLVALFYITLTHECVRACLCLCVCESWD